MNNQLTAVSRIYLLAHKTFSYEILVDNGGNFFVKEAGFPESPAKNFDMAVWKVIKLMRYDKLNTLQQSDADIIQRKHKHNLTLGELRDYKNSSLNPSFYKETFRTIKDGKSEEYFHIDMEGDRFPVSNEIISLIQNKEAA